MGKTEVENDVLKDGVLRIVLNIGAPLLAVQLLSMLAASYTNQIYSRYFGKLVFLVTGVLSSVIALFQSAYSSVASGTWIRSAAAYAEEDRGRANRVTVNALYSVTLVVLLCMLALLLGKGCIFRAMNVPLEIHREAGLYYYAQVALMPFAGINAMLNTIITARGRRGMVFAENLLFVCGPAIAAMLFIAVLRMGFWGWLLGSIPVTLAHIGVQWAFLKKCGIVAGLKPEHFRPDWESIFGNARYGCLLYTQMILCCISEMAISMQSNRYLDMDEIATVTILLPLTSPLAVCSTLCSVFVPQNYGAGKTLRLRRFVSGAIWFGAVYGVGCALFHMLAGEWYFGTLFDDMAMIELGREYWFWYGLGCIPLAMIYVIRVFFDSVGMAKVSMLSGAGELLGRLVCAFWLIPCFGYIGRFAAPLLGWGLGGLMMTVMYFALRKKIWEKCDRNGRWT
jgi:Na+-driven multidrug efflux pump|nr:MATE family efflux transporter [uncultured Acetatifactor sp.]